MFSPRVYIIATPYTSYEGLPSDRAECESKKCRELLKIVTADQNLALSVEIRQMRHAIVDDITEIHVR